MKKITKIILSIMTISFSFLLIILCTGCDKSSGISNLGIKNRNDLTLYNDNGYNREINLSDEVETVYEDIDTTQFEKDVLEVRLTILTSLEKITSSKKEIMEKDGAVTGTCYIVKNSKTNDYIKFCDNGEAVYSNNNARIVYKFVSDDFAVYFKELDEAVKNEYKITQKFVQENFGYKLP